MESIQEIFDLSGKTALVTGGALGIGQAISFRLGEAGANIVVADVDLAAAEKTVKALQDRGTDARAVKVDVSNAEEVDRAVKDSVEAFGRIDFLINNAGIFPLVPVLDASEELWDRVIDINLKGAFLFAQKVGKQMASDQKGGKIINLASIDALRPNGMATHYNASKGGVLMLTKALALELAPHGIHVNAVAPGGITTPGTDEARAKVSENIGVPEEAIVGGWVQRVPLQRMGEPDDVAKVVLFLASSAADFITGEVILVDGGYLLS